MPSQNHYEHQFPTDLPELLTPEYSKEERRFFQTEPRTRQGKLGQLMMRIKTDNTRYEKAIQLHPEKVDHYSRLIAIGEASMDAWQEYYGLRVMSMVPFDGSEPRQIISEFVTVPTGPHVDIPA